MGKNRGQIRSDIQSNLTDLSLNFYSEDDINNSIQDAYTDISILTQCIQQKITIDWISNLSYYNFVALGISDYLGVIAIFNNITNLWLRDDLSLKDFDRIRRDWELWIGSPQFWAPSDPLNIAIAAKYLSSQANTWELSTTIPDGIQTSFAFPSTPTQCSFNGLNQFNGSGYLLSRVGNTFFVTFIDSNNNVITPQAGDDIRGYLAAGDLGTFILFYWAVAPTLSSDSDTFLIASDMEKLLIHYATADLLEEAQELNKAVDWWNSYNQGIESYADRVKRNTKSDLLLRI